MSLMTLKYANLNLYLQPSFSVWFSYSTYTCDLSSMEILFFLYIIFQLSTGEVCVQFGDGAQLAIQSNPMLVSFTDAKGNCCK